MVSSNRHVSNSAALAHVSILYEEEMAGFQSLYRATGCTFPYCDLSEAIQSEISADDAPETRRLRTIDGKVSS